MKSKLTKKQKNRVIIIAAGMILILAAMYTLFVAPYLNREQWIYMDAIVERGNLTVGISESGSLTYGTTDILYELDLSIEDDDEDDEDDEEERVEKYLEIEEIYIAAGTQINEGTQILKFTQSSIDSVRRILESGVIEAQVDYNEAESEYKLAALEAETNYQIQVLNSNYGKKIYTLSVTEIDNEIAMLEIEIENRKANIINLEEAVMEAYSDYKDALDTYEDAKRSFELVGAGHIPNYITVQREYSQAQNSFQSAESTYTKAQESVVENEEAIQSLEKQLVLAKAKKTIEEISVEQEYQETLLYGTYGELSYLATLENLQKDLEEAEADMKEMEDKLSAFEEFVGQEGILYATEEGLITALNYQVEDTLINQGIILSYVKADDMTISVDVTQEDIVTLSVGDRVDIHFTAYEEAIYEGKILSIDTTATSQDTDTVSYTVIVGVEGSLDELFGGMTADITFVTEEKEDVLYVSRKAIVTENGKTYVYVKDALGNYQLQEVETGTSNGSYIEIISGLAEGDTIYIASRVSEEVSSQMEGTSSQNRTQELSGDGIEIPREKSSDMPEGMQNMPGEIPEGMESLPNMQEGGQGSRPDMSGEMPSGMPENMSGERGQRGQ